MATPHTPFVDPRSSPLELTARGLVVGSLLGIVFAASSVYLGLKVGLTVSASIPVAVLSITLFRWFARALRLAPATILENNLVQTVGSAGESLAAGVAFTLPSLLLMGHDLELVRVMLVALFGGLIGTLMMIPLRQGLIVKEHGTLAYPEGTACADVLIVGEQGGTNAKTVFLGFFVGGGYALLNLVAKLWADTATFSVAFWGRLKGGTLAFEVSPPMLGVGYIIGPKVAANMMAGGTLAFLVLIPLIHFFGDPSGAPIYPGLVPVAEMSAGQLRNTYILYIGAGAVATGGFLALARAIPTIIGAFRAGLAAIGEGSGEKLRTEQDLPMSLVLGGSLAIALAIWAAPMLEINLVSAVLIVLFGFFFVTVSSRITGEIGSSSNPISGMTVATLLITCGLFVLIGWTGPSYKAMALTTAALVCVAASNGGTTSQDLKTGFLVGATPRFQQIGLTVGVVTSSVVIGFVLLLLNQSHTTYEPLPDSPIVLTPGEQRMAGPDGEERPVAYVQADDVGLERGKYLLDAGGHPVYRVDPGVCGTFPFRDVASTVSGVAVPADAPTELGPDRQPYARVERDGETLLVDASGAAHWERTPLWKFDAPKAQLFRLIIDGTLGGRLPWDLVIVGVLLALMMELVGVAALPFAVGLYLPISTSAGVFVGGIVRWLVDRARRGESSAEAEFSPGMLMASGLIAGGAIAGVLQSIVAYAEADAMFDLSGLLGPLAHSEGVWPMVPFVAMATALWFVGRKR